MLRRMRLKPLTVEVFFTVLVLIIIAELGDKTQLILITLSAEVKKPHLTFLGAMIGFILVNGIGVLIGEILTIYVPLIIIRIVTGIIFIVFGFGLLLKKVKIDQKNEITRDRPEFITSLIFIATCELGDKTQIITILLTATYQLPITVFFGVLTGLALISGLGVFLGTNFSRLIPQDKLRRVAGIIFVLFGMLTILGFW